MEPKYRPLNLRTPNSMYSRSLARILKKGQLTKNPFQTMGTYTLLTLAPMIFKLSNGFPVITERKIGFWRRPIAELLAFVNGVRDADILAEWGCKWWGEQWATAEKCAQFGLEPRDLGPGSYGAAFHDFPHFEWEPVEGHTDGGRFVPKPFNQFEHLIKQMKRYPSMRTHKITSWIPQYCLQHDGLQRKVVVAPCHGDIQITVIDGRLTLRMDQRSADFPIGVPSNIIQYAALTMMIAHLTGHEPYMYIHAPHDAQIYEDQVDNVREIVSRKPLPFPTLHFTEEGSRVTNLFDFRPSHFELREYNSHPAISGIPATT